jgi:hypothetical protein
MDSSSLPDTQSGSPTGPTATENSVLDEAFGAAVDSLLDSDDPDGSDEDESDESDEEDDSLSSKPRRFEMEINIYRLCTLASDIATRHLDKPHESAKVVDVFDGHVNRVFVIELRPDATRMGDDPFKMVMRIPLRSPGVEMSVLEVDSMKSHAATLRYIRKKTSVPVPEVYAFDVTTKNIINLPYMCLSFLPGMPLVDLWYDNESQPALQEPLRLNMLSSLAKIMAQFSAFTFDKHGSIFEDTSGEFYVGPGCEQDTEIEVRGPHDSGFASAVARYEEYSAWLDTLAVEETRNCPSSLGMDLVMRMLIQSLGKLDASCSGYVLCPYDFNDGDVLVDAHGNVTGLINWELAKTVPRYAGYIRYPLFVWEDWDPPLIWEEKRPNYKEPSSESLERYRSFYLKALKKSLGDHPDTALIERSHITTMIWQSMHSFIYTRSLCMKALVTVQYRVVDEKNPHFNTDDDYDGEAEIYDLGLGVPEEVVVELQRKLDVLVLGESSM